MAAPDLNFLELMRWFWRQLTSMRTALVLLLMLALAAIPGSVIPQSDVDAAAVERWQDQHPQLTPIYEWLGLFGVFDSVWFAAIYLLLVISLVGCIIPRTVKYWKGFRAAPPKAPRNLLRLQDSASYTTDVPAEEVLEQATALLRKRRRYRVVVTDEAVSAERGHFREVGNLIFHLSVLVVLAGFAMGSLFGYKGGVIVPVGSGFSNNLAQYDDFVPGSLMGIEDMEPFSFTVDDFDIEWLLSGPRKGMAQHFVAHTNYQETPGGEDKEYDLRVNHPLNIGGTSIFLIGHGYAPNITVRDGNGDIAYSGPTIFLPEDQATFTSFGVVKAPAAEPQQIGLEGLLYPTYLKVDGNPTSVLGDDRNPVLSMQAYVGDLGMESGESQSVYVLDKDKAKLVKKEDGSMFRVDLQLCAKDAKKCASDTVKLPNGAGTVTFDGIQPWVRLQISKTPGTGIALTGVILALLGLLGSLFIRPRRVWVRARREDGVTVVEVAGLDRSGASETKDEIVDIVTALGGSPSSDGEEKQA
ncbi:MAG: cytochrome c biogenesis protein ResB [Nocardioides sp.]|nr:cytochrome c biogenesis protein ResB [Nocardioides sp.]